MSDMSYDYLRVSLLPNIGVNRGKALLRETGSFGGLIKASIKDLIAVEGIQKTLAEQLHSNLHDSALLDEIERSVERASSYCEKHNTRYLTIEDEDYPAPLRKIYDPPLYVFCKGSFTEQDERSLAIVGTRQPTDYGRQATAHFADALAQAGVTIVSGLAIGVDTIAHHRATANSARTVAVLGSGVNVIYPFSNKKIASEIEQRGALISEFLPDTKPDASNFPRRNRIISGLSLGTLVVEAGIRSGATLTAHFAFDQNKDVFAVPGNIFSSKSEGTNELIKKNIATPVTNVEDIYNVIEALRPGTQPRSSAPPVQLTMEEGVIMEALSLEPVHIDALAGATGRNTAELLIHLLQLEFKGVVRQLPGKYFVLSKQ